MIAGILFAVFVALMLIGVPVGVAPVATAPIYNVRRYH